MFAKLWKAILAVVEISVILAKSPDSKVSSLIGPASRVFGIVVVWLRESALIFMFKNSNSKVLL
jgi:hypothetical protein